MTKEKWTTYGGGIAKFLVTDNRILNLRYRGHQYYSILERDKTTRDQVRDFIRIIDRKTEFSL